MQPVASRLSQFHAPAAHTTATRACCSPASCTDRPAEDQSSAQVRTVKKALMQHVVATLRARLEVVVSGPAKVAGLTDDEQASNQLANAVSSALQSTCPDDVRTSVQDGMQEAATSLQESGASANDVDAALADLSDKLNTLFAAFTPAASTPGTSDVTAAGARIVTKEKGVLEIRTQEGDIVKVKFATKTDMRADTAQVTTHDRTSTSSSFSIATRSRTELSVQGDLNADELEAIHEVVQKVDALANDFFAGSVDKALAQAADLDIDTEQLANVALRLSMTQRAEAAAVSVQHLPPPAAPATATEEPASAEETAAESQSASVSEPAPVVADAVGTANEAGSPASADSPQAVIAKFVSRVLAAFQSSDSETHMSLSFKMKLQLLSSAIEAKQLEGSTQSPAGVQKLCDVVEAAQSGS